MCVLPEAVCSGEEDRGRPSLKRGGQVFLQSRVYNSCAALLEPSDKLSRIAGDHVTLKVLLQSGLSYTLLSCMHTSVCARE